MYTARKESMNPGMNIPLLVAGRIGYNLTMVADRLLKTSGPMEPGSTTLSVNT